MHFDKITARITKLSYGLNPEFCDPVRGLGSQQPHAGCADGALMLTCALHDLRRPGVEPACACRRCWLHRR